MGNVTFRAAKSVLVLVLVLVPAASVPVPAVLAAPEGMAWVSRL